MKHIELYEEFSGEGYSASPGGYQLIGLYTNEEFESAKGAIQELEAELGTKCMWDILYSDYTWNQFVKPGLSFALLSNGTDMVSAIVDDFSNEIVFGPMDGNNRNVRDSFFIDQIKKALN